MKIHKRILTPLVMTCLLLASENVFAARDYLVELVVFSNPGEQSEESWTNAFPPLDANKMSRALLPSEITPPDDPATSEIKELGVSTFHRYVERIQRDSSRKILLQARWVQEVRDPGSTTIARITDLQAKDDPASNAQQEQETGSRFRKGFATILPADKSRNETTPVLDGFVDFFVDGYYALETDLRYTPPYRPSILDDNPGNGPATYRIHEQRKMKSGELNYYDHPRFGMVLLVTPVKSLAEQPGEAEQAPAAISKDRL